MPIAVILVYALIILIIFFAFFDKSHYILETIKNILYSTRHKFPKTVWNLPGPVQLPLLGTKWIFYTKYKFSKLHLAYQQMNQQFGPIVLEVVPSGIPVVSLFEREDIEKVLKYPSKYPFRPPTEIAVKYRLTRPDRYASTGMTNEYNI